MFNPGHPFWQMADVTEAVMKTAGTERDFKIGHLGIRKGEKIKWDLLER